MEGEVGLHLGLLHCLMYEQEQYEAPLPGRKGGDGEVSGARSIRRPDLDAAKCLDTAGARASRVIAPLAVVLQ